MGKTANINALILAGGKSSRMGRDKSQIVYHGQRPQELYLADMCEKLGLPTFISKGYDYVGTCVEKYHVIRDVEQEKGPLAAIIVAMQSRPAEAWLVLACDMPHVTAEHISKLLVERDSSCAATCYQMQGGGRLQPLFCIYEPSVLAALVIELERGKGRPTSVLEESRVKAVLIDDGKAMLNVNTVEELGEVHRYKG